MTITIAANSVPKPPAEIIEGFRNAPTSISQTISAGCRVRSGSNPIIAAAG